MRGGDARAVVTLPRRVAGEGVRVRRGVGVGGEGCVCVATRRCRCAGCACHAACGHRTGGGEAGVDGEG